MKDLSHCTLRSWAYISLWVSPRREFLPTSHTRPVQKTDSSHNRKQLVKLKDKIFLLKMLWEINNFFSPWGSKVQFSHIAQESEQSNRAAKRCIVPRWEAEPRGLKTKWSSKAFRLILTKDLCLLHLLGDTSHSETVWKIQDSTKIINK